MGDGNFSIRTMTRNEVDLAVEWAAQEGWNPGRYDAQCYYIADSTGFLIGMLNNEPAATISAVKYGDTFGFLGFYIVHPQHRGKGLGIQIWNEGLKYLAGRNVGLDGVVAQQEKYMKTGFKLAYRNIRFEGYGGENGSGNPAIVPLSSISFEAVRDYSSKFFPEDRSDFLRCWIYQPESYASGILHNSRLAGYGVLRSCRTGYKIGPLFADDAELAELLFLELKSKVGSSEQVYLDVPEINSHGIDLAERYKMKAAFETARMYSREFPEINIKQTFGVTSFEVG